MRRIALKRKSPIYFRSMSEASKCRHVAIIAGGMGDIGRAIATRLSRDGFCVGLLGLPVPDSETGTFLDSLTGDGHAWTECDLSSPEQVKNTVRKFASQGRLAVCVQSASPSIQRASLAEASSEEFARQFNVHVNGTRFLFQEAATFMRGHGGRLIGITTAALDPNLRAKRMGAYLVAKAAMVGIMRELAKDLAGERITVNAVAPGYVATRLNRDLPERLVDFVKEANPMKLNITSEDVAGVVSFLCSEDARAITGVSIPVTGGESMTL